MILKPSVIGLNLAAATSVANVLMDVCRKKALNRNDLFSATFWIRLASASVLIAAFLFRLNNPHGPLIHDSGPAIAILGWHVPVLLEYLLFLLLDTGLIAVVVYLYFSALQESDLSLCIPFLSFTPVLLIPSGYLFLHEAPTQRQLIGVLLVVCGSMLMNRDAFRFGLLGPVRAILHQKGSRNFLICAVIYAITNPLDKRLVLMSDSVTYAMCYGVTVCLIYFILATRMGSGWQAALRSAPFWICTAGILDACSLLLQFTSHNYIDVFITITIKRAGVILSVFAGWLIFREKHIEDRLVASITMLGGVILIYIPMSPIEQAMLVAALLIFVFTWLRTHPVRPAIDAVGTLAPASETSGTLRALSDGPTLPAHVGDPRILRCAMLGCGEIVWRYLDVYRDMPWVRVAACVDIDTSRAQAAADYLAKGGRANGTPRVSTKFEAALANDVDVVVISTPNHLHREHAVAALQQGKHIFLQKPIANTLQDGMEILRVAQRLPNIAGIYMSDFDQPGVHDLRAMVASGFFGKITQVHMKLMHPNGLHWARQSRIGHRLWRGSVEQTGGGAFIQLAVHSVRAMSWILSERVTHVQGFAANRLCPELEGEDSAVALLRFESGTYATLNMSWCASGEELAIYGSEGSAVYEYDRWVTLRSSQDYKGIAFHYKAPHETTFDCLSPHVSPAHEPCNQHRTFLEAVRDGRPPFVSLQDGVEDMLVVSAFYEAVRTGACVVVGSGPTQLPIAIEC